MNYVVTIGAIRPYVVTTYTLSQAFLVIGRYLDTPFQITLKRVKA